MAKKVTTSYETYSPMPYILMIIVGGLLAVMDRIPGLESFAFNFNGFDHQKAGGIAVGIGIFLLFLNRFHVAKEKANREMHSKKLRSQIQSRRMTEGTDRNYSSSQRRKK